MPRYKRMADSNNLLIICFLLLAISFTGHSATTGRPDENEDTGDEDRGYLAAGHEDHLTPELELPYDDWVDHVVSSFSADSPLPVTEINKVYLSGVQQIIHRLQRKETDLTLLLAARHLCGRAKLAPFIRVLWEKNICLTALEEQLDNEVLTSSPTGVTSLRNEVSTRLSCRVLSPALSCHEPVLAALVNCVGDGNAALRATTEVRRLVADYCLDNSANITRFLEDSPEHCLPVGVAYLVRFLGPSFLANVKAPELEDYPCAVANYFTLASNVVLMKYCQASSLLNKLSAIENNFSGTVGCPNARKISDL